MLKVKKIMVGDYVENVVCVEECKWNELANTWQVMEMVCEGFNLPIKVMVEVLDGYLMAQSDGEIFEFPREVKTVPVETYYSFGLSNGTYGIATGTEINEMLDDEITVYKQETASYEDIEWLACCGTVTIEDGTYLISDGILEVVNGELEHVILKEVV